MDIKTKVEGVLRALCEVNPKLEQECTVDYQTVDSALIYGPFPSFLILVNIIGKAHVIIHVNADAPNMFYLFNKLNLDFTFDGAFAVDSQTANIIMGEEAYKKKSENILLLAQQIIEDRKSQSKELIVPDKKIILVD